MKGLADDARIILYKLVKSDEKQSNAVTGM
jgi:hypothetical protein